MPSSPGTVSKILWHFTGGPPWNEAEERQEDDPKPSEKAYEALLNIMKSRELWLGKYKEKINVDISDVLSPEQRSSHIMRFNKSITMQSVPVNCLADIPVIHLGYHSKSYGKMAIGFHRSSAIRHGFSPVFYQLEDSKVLLSIIAGTMYLGDIGHDITDSNLSDVVYLLNKLFEDDVSHDEPKVDAALPKLGASLSRIMESLRHTATAFRRLIAFIKTFKEHQFGTIYCEREWSSIQQFNFGYDDVSMIALPRSTGKGDYFERFVEEAKAIPLPATVSIVAWDDLVEH